MQITKYVIIIHIGLLANKILDITDGITKKKYKIYYNKIPRWMTYAHYKKDSYKSS